MRLNVEFEKNAYDQLGTLAAEEKSTISAIVRGLVLEWIAEKWRQKALPPVVREADENEVQDVG